MWAMWVAWRRRRSQVTAPEAASAVVDGAMGERSWAKPAGVVWWGGGLAGAHGVAGVVPRALQVVADSGARVALGPTGGRGRRWVMFPADVATGDRLVSRLGGK